MNSPNELAYQRISTSILTFALGKLGNNYVERKDGNIKQLSNTATVEMEKNDIFIIETPNGGGYGT